MEKSIVNAAVDPADFLNQNQSKKSKAPVKREFVLSEEMKELAQEIIKEQRLDIFPAKVEYLTVYPNLSRTMASKIIKTGKELKFFANLDYIIEISGEIWDVLDLNTKKILLEHQLRHILVIQNDKSGDWVYKIRKHDVQDFAKVISQYGVEWIRTIRLALSSMYDLSPTEEDNISI